MRSLIFAAAILLATPAHAQIAVDGEVADDYSLLLYPGDDAFDFVETAQAGHYEADLTGLAAGTYTGRVYNREATGLDPATHAALWVLSVTEFEWDGSAIVEAGGATLFPTVKVSAPPLAYVPKSGSKKTRYTMVIRDEAGELVDPDGNTISLAYADPDGGSLPTLPASATRASVGRYHFDVTALSSQSTQQKLVATATGTIGDYDVVEAINIQFLATPPAQIIVNQ